MEKEKTLIPKLIHLTWFSGEPFPENLQRCIYSWKQTLPDYKIMIWDMDMARNLNIPFVNEAIDLKKWAFAGDVVRAYAVWKYGGVYMDTDVYVLKSFDDFLNQEMVFFIELNKKEWETYNPKGVFDSEWHCIDSNCFIRGRQIQAACFMGVKGNACLKEIVDLYRTRHFLNSDGTPDMSVISPSLYAKVLEKYGFVYEDKEQHLGNIVVYPSSFIALSQYECHPNTIAVHLGAHSWNPRGFWSEIKYKIKTSPIGPFVSKLLNK